MSIRQPLLRSMAWLAFAAALLVAIAPPISRFVAASPFSTGSGASEDCHPESSESSRQIASPGEHHGSPESWGEEGHCAYCPLASQLCGTGSYHLAVSRESFGDLPGAHVHAPRLQVPRNIRSLGSRAPPVG